MILRKRKLKYAQAFAEYCGERADYLPTTKLWICYQDAGTVKKTTGEMMKDFQQHIVESIKPVRIK